jgi:hypothetical protein
MARRGRSAAAQPGPAFLREHGSQLQIGRDREPDEERRQGAREKTGGADVHHGPHLPRPVSPHWGRHRLLLRTAVCAG